MDNSEVPVSNRISSWSHLRRFDVVGVLVTEVIWACGVAISGVAGTSLGVLGVAGTLSCGVRVRLVSTGMDADVESREFSIESSPDEGDGVSFEKTTTLAGGFRS